MLFNPWKSHDPFSSLWGRTFSVLYALSMQLMSGCTVSSLREGTFGLNIIFWSHATPKVPSSSRFVNFMREYFLSAGAEVRFEAWSYDDLSLYRRGNKRPPSGMLWFVTLTISMQTFEYTVERLLWESTQRGTPERSPQHSVLLPFVSSTLPLSSSILHLFCEELQQLLISINRNAGEKEKTKKKQYEAHLSLVISHHSICLLVGRLKRQHNCNFPNSSAVAFQCSGVERWSFEHRKH